MSLSAYYCELVNSLSSGRNLAVASCGMSLTVENLVLVAPLVVTVGHSKKVAKAFLLFLDLQAFQRRSPALTFCCSKINLIFPMIFWFLTISFLFQESKKEKKSKKDSRTFLF